MKRNWFGWDDKYRVIQNYYYYYITDYFHHRLFVAFINELMPFKMPNIWSTFEEI